MTDVKDAYFNGEREFGVEIVMKNPSLEIIDREIRLARIILKLFCGFKTFVGG